MIRLAAIAVVLIAAWLSLTPRPPQIEGLPAGSDLAVHAIMHIGLAGALWIGWPTRKPWVIAAALVLAVGLEVGQLWVPGRTFEFGDLRANLAGSVLGMVLADRLALPLARRFAQRYPASARWLGLSPPR